MDMDVEGNNFTGVMTSTNSSVTPGLMERAPHLTRFMLFLYALIFIVGTFGNSLVLYVVIKYKPMQTITNKFIACLSVSDLLICLFAIPFTPTNALVESWQFGEFICKLVPMVLLISVFVSTLTSVAIALDRYMVIVHPHATRLTANVQVIIIIAIWLLAASAAVPIGIFTSLEKRQFSNTLDCQERWPNNTSSEVYTWVIFTLQLLVPAVIITFCYAAVGLQLSRRTRMRFHSCVANRDVAKEQEASRNCRINKMLVAMTAIFIICWLPIDLIYAIGMPDEYFLTVFLFFHILAMSSVMYNPLLYGWMNDNFNKYFREIWSSFTACCCRRWRKKYMNSGKNKNRNPSGKHRLVTLQTSINGCAPASLLESNNCTEPMASTLEAQPCLPQNNNCAV